MKCKNCGAEMEYSVQDKCTVWKCPSCTWNLVTTYSAPLETDQEMRTVTVSPFDKMDITVIRMVANMLNCNYAQSRTALQKGFCIENISAVTAYTTVMKLKEYGINVSVVPELPGVL